MTRPNILFLLSDEHSFRFMGHLPPEEGGEPVETPALDNLAKHGVRFTDTYCQMPLCTPSRLSLLTGLEARKCGAWGNEVVLRPELPTLPKVLGSAGYETCLVGKMHLHGTNQFAGFNTDPMAISPERQGTNGNPWKARTPALIECDSGQPEQESLKYQKVRYRNIWSQKKVWLLLVNSRTIIQRLPGSCVCRSAGRIFH